MRKATKTLISTTVIDNIHCYYNIQLLLTTTMIILFENVVSSICINLATSALSSRITAHAQDEPISYFNRKKTLA